MHLFDPDATTEPNRGLEVSARGVEDLLGSGFILLDKAAGPTSHQLTAWVRDMFGVDKLGHGGTLDPFATGVLTLLFGKTMKLTSRILSHNKTYIAVLRFSSPCSKEELVSVLENQIGRVYNIPPEVSAVKVQVRTRNIESIDILDQNEDFVILKIDCEAGTYIRTMARDIGLMLDRKIELRELRRVRSGDFSLEESVSIQQVADAFWLWKENGDDTSLKKIIHPVERLLDSLPKVVIKDGAIGAICHGAPLHRPGIISIEEDLEAGTEVLLQSLKGEAVAIAKLELSSNDMVGINQGEMARPNTVLMNQDTYPRQWGS